MNGNGKTQQPVVHTDRLDTIEEVCVCSAALLQAQTQSDGAVEQQDGTMSSGLRKRKSTTPSKGNKKTSRMDDASSASSEASPTNSHTDTSEANDATDVLDSSMTSVGDVVDLTCEGADPAVVDLTNNDSIVVVDERSLNKSPESYVVSSDEDDRTNEEQNSRTRAMPGTISCPVCMDAYAEIVDSGRLVVSTRCGHVFCSQCLRDALRHSHSCPTCRKKLTPRQYHPIYI